MNFRFFESFREWVHKTRRRKDSKKPSGAVTLEGARVGCSGGIHCNPVSGEIILRSEPPLSEFIRKHGSPRSLLA